MHGATRYSHAEKNITECKPTTLNPPHINSHKPRRKILAAANICVSLSEKPRTSSRIPMGNYCVRYISKASRQRYAMRQQEFLAPKVCGASGK